MRGEFITGTNKVSNPPLVPDLLATNLHTRRCISLHTSNSALSLLLPSVLVLLQPPGGSCKEAIAAGNQKPRISLGCTGMGCFSRSPCISRGGVSVFPTSAITFSADDCVRFQHDEDMDADRFPAGLRVLAVDEDRVNLVVLKRVLMVCDYNNGE